MARAGNLGDLGEYLQECVGEFDCTDVADELPTRACNGLWVLQVGANAGHRIAVGAAHTRGDVLVHVPGDRTVFTGDILFIEGTPLMWAGPVANWLAACDRILAMDVDVIVPGHGPITDKAGVRRMRGYLEYVQQEAKKRYDAGLSLRDAIHDIALGDYDAWLDAERIAINVDTLYREFSGTAKPTDTLTLFTLMAEVKQQRKARR